MESKGAATEKGVVTYEFAGKPIGYAVRKVLTEANHPMTELEIATEIAARGIRPGEDLNEIIRITGGGIKYFLDDQRKRPAKPADRLKEKDGRIGFNDWPDDMWKS
jgi:hypothetical protein